MDGTRAAPVEREPYPSEVTRELGETTESGQLDLVVALREQVNAALDRVTDVEETINPEIDANPDDKLLMEALDLASDARDSLRELSDLLNTMAARDVNTG